MLIPSEMLSLLKANYGLKQIDQLLHKFPYSVYVKDIKGNYIDANEEGARTSGVASVEDIVGRTDYDFEWENQAPFMQENDRQVIESNKLNLFYEYADSIYGKNKVNQSFKAPVHSLTGKIIGIFGISTITDYIELPKINTKPEVQKNCSAVYYKKSVLSKRQQECLYLLSLGMTMKQIAFELHLSPKTVEHYIEAVKIKLNCRSRYELIKKALVTGLLNNRTLSCKK